MKILHTSDWHLGKTAPVINDYSADQWYFLQQLQQLIEAEQVDAVLCAGDVYDSGKVSAEAIDLYSDMASAICIQMRKPLVVIAGNHDSAERLAACNQLLAKAGLHVKGRLDKCLEPVLLQDGKVAVYALPFFQPGEVDALWPELKIHTMPEAVQAVLAEIRSKLDPSRCNILMAHLSVAGAELSESDRSAVNSNAENGHMIGGSSSVNAALLEGFDYVALGHIHKPQKLADCICYSGSPIRYSFGREETQQKGVWIFDTASKDMKFCPLKEKHDRLTLVCTYDEAIQRTDLKDTYLRLTLTDRMCTMELLDDMKNRFPFLMEFHGQQSNDSGAHTSLTDADFQTLSDTEVLAAYMKDVFSEELESDLSDLFIQAMSNTEKEDLQ